MELKASFERSRSEIPVHVASVHCFRYLQTNCSRKALDILLKLHNSIKEGDSGECNCTLPITHGLPCAHRIAAYVKDRSIIPLTAIHPMWKTLEFLDAGELDSDKEATRRYEDATKEQFDQEFSTMPAERRKQVTDMLDNFLNPGKMIGICFVLLFVNFFIDEFVVV